MKKIKILMVMLFLVLVSGCGPSYNRDTSAGSIKEITYDDAKKMIHEDETVIMFFSQTNCGGCQAYKEMLNEYLKNHHVIMYEFNFTNHEGTPEEKSEIFTKDLPGMIKDMTDDEEQYFVGTPYTLVMQSGELKEGISGALDVDEFDKLVMKYQLDENKE